MLSKIWLKSTLSVAIFIQDPWDTTAMANCKNSSWQIFGETSLC